MLILSLFPGIDIFGQGFEQEGFCVVRGPEIFLGQDIRNFKSLKGKFDGIIGGPPCQVFSEANTTNPTNVINLIPEFERIVQESEPLFWIMENVSITSPPRGSIWSELLDSWEFGSYQRRIRRFSSNLDLRDYLIRVPETLRKRTLFPTVLASEYKLQNNRGASHSINRRLRIEEINVLMGLPKNYSTPLFTLEGSYKVRGNGVSLEVSQELAKAVKRYVNAKSRNLATNSSESSFQ